MAEKQPSSDVKEAPVKSGPKKIKANLADAQILESEKDFVHYFLTDTNARKPAQTQEWEEWKVPRIPRKQSPEAFIACFKDHFEANRRFGTMVTASHIYSVMKNLTQKEFERRFKRVIDGWANTLEGPDLESKIKFEYERFKCPGVAGGPQKIVSIKDIIHLPGLDQKTIDKIPENV